MLSELVGSSSSILLSPIIKGRKGHYRDLFEQIRKQGFTKVRIDGVVKEIEFGMQLDRYKIHDIEIVIDKIISSDREGRPVSGSVFEIANIIKGKGLSELLISRNKMGQQIITGICDDIPGITDIIIIGEDFYEFSRASDGKFYLESGSVSGEKKQVGK